jgi:predicted SAM-dependent methyltransferase
MKLLNIGCGSSLHPEWTNIDLVASSPNVQSHDVRKGLPYPDRYFDACYSSHVLEHHTQTDAKNLVSECFRVLKPQGVVRVVVPDLESIVRSYLHTLEQVEAGIMEAEPDYTWMTLELLDQIVRSSKGGEMINYLSSPNLQNKQFVKSRIGWEAEQNWLQQEEKTNWQKLKSKSWSWLLHNLRICLAQNIVKITAGKEAKLAFDEGLMRNTGEIHRWMYDRFSLRRLLSKVGFKDVLVCRADESRIPEFNTYSLDMVEGVVRKPDSLFIEGIKL